MKNKISMYLPNIIFLSVDVLIFYSSIVTGKGIFTGTLSFIMFLLFFGYGVNCRKENYKFISRGKYKFQTIFMLLVLFSNFFLPLTSTTREYLIGSIYLLVILHSLLFSAIVVNFLVYFIEKKTTGYTEEIFKQHKQYWIQVVIYFVLTIATFFIGLALVL